MSTTSSPSRWVDFKRLKAEVSLQQVLDRYEIELVKRGKSHRGRCLLHDGENATSLSVDLDGNKWHCFSCKAGGNVLDFVAAKEKVDLRAAALLVCDWFSLSHKRSGGAGTTGTAPPPTKTSPSPVAPEVPGDVEPNNVLTFELSLAPSDYLRDRGVSDETAAHFGVGLCSRGVMKDRIAIPIRNADAQLVGYAGRWPGEPPDDETPKYRFPDGFKKSQELFNLHQVQVAPREQPLVIVEGFFDVFNLWQVGLQRVVATMGSNPSPLQLDAILELGRGDRIVLLYDDDDAGTTGTDILLEALEGHAYLLMPSFPEGVTQPDELTADQLRSMIP